MTGTFTRHNAEQCLTNIGGRNLGLRRKELETLAEQNLYPSIFTTSQDFLDNCIKPVISCFDDGTDAIRERAVGAAIPLIAQLGSESLSATFRTALEMIFLRIENEPTEEIQILLVELLKQLASLPNDNSSPPNFDEYAPKALLVLSKRMKSRDPKMKKLICSTVDVICKHTTRDCLSANASLISRQLVATVSHNHLEVRKQTLLVLGELLVSAGTTDNLDELVEMQDKLCQDTKAAFRIANVSFCRNILTNHPSRAQLTDDFMFPLLISAAKLCIDKPIFPGEKPEAPKESKEGKSAFEALCEIGEQCEKDSPPLDTQIGLKFKFDGDREYPFGLLRAVQFHFEPFLRRSLLHIANFIAANRVLGYSALASLLRFAALFASRFSGRILPALVAAMQDHPDEVDRIKRLVADLAEQTPLSDINDIVLPKMSRESAPQLLDSYAVCLLNAKPNDEAAAAGIDKIMSAEMYVIPENADACARCVLAVCERCPTLRSEYESQLLYTAMRSGEHFAQERKQDHLYNETCNTVFGECFGAPLNEVIGRNIRSLFGFPGVNPHLISQVLLTAPPSAVASNCDCVCSAIVGQLRGFASRTVMYRLLSELCSRQAIPFLSDDLLSAILDDMVWRSGREAVPTRESATASLGASIKSGAISEKRLNDELSRVFPMALSSLDDQTSDLVRTAAVSTLREVLIRVDSLDDRFPRTFDALKERLSDPLLTVRVSAAELIRLIIMKSQNLDGVTERFGDVFIFMDDGSEDMRNAIAQIVIETSSVPKWRDDVRKTVELLLPNNYHVEATQLCKELLSKI